MEFYAFNLVGFALANLFLLYRYYRHIHGTKKVDEESKESNLSADSHVQASQAREISKFLLDYFPAYAFAVAADWIQVSHNVNIAQPNATLAGSSVQNDGVLSFSHPRDHIFTPSTNMTNNFPRGSSALSMPSALSVALSPLPLSGG